MTRRRKTPCPPLCPGSLVVGYVRVSTVEQADSGAGMAAQRTAIEEAAARSGWRIVDICEDAGVSGSKTSRPGLDRALRLVETGAACGLVAAKVDRLSRSLLDFCGLMERAELHGWWLVVLDAGMDMSSPAGRAMVRMLATFAELERDLIRQRTRDAMTASRAAGGPAAGRKVTVPREVSQLIVGYRKAGMSYAAIASRLASDGVPTGQGGRWWPSTVRDIAGRAAA